MSAWAKITPLSQLESGHTEDWIKLDAIERIYVEPNTNAFGKALVPPCRTMLVLSSGRILAVVETAESFRI